MILEKWVFLINFLRIYCFLTFLLFLGGRKCFRGGGSELGEEAVGRVFRRLLVGGLGGCLDLGRMCFLCRVG